MTAVAGTDHVTLDEFEAFGGLASEELCELEERFRRVRFPAGTSMGVAERPGDSIYLVLDGTVKIEAGAKDGSSVILALFGPGELIGEASVVDSLGRSATIVTIEESEVAWMDGAAFEDCMRRMPQLTEHVLGVLSRRLRLANGHLQSLATLDVFGRIAYQLLALAREFGKAGADGGTCIPIRLTQEDLAGLVGASRVRVNQAVVTFKRLGYIGVNGNHHITVHDYAALSRQAGVPEHAA